MAEGEKDDSSLLRVVCAGYSFRAALERISIENAARYSTIPKWWRSFPSSLACTENKAQVGRLLVGRPS